MRTAAYYRDRASYFRSLADGTDARTAADLIRLAENYEMEARRLEPEAEPPITTAG